jgi:photosystem II stability/assembly factor-like uncharacterized protein
LFWDDKQGFAVGDGATYVTNDGGNSWTTSVFGTGRRVVRGYPNEAGSPTFCFLDRDNGWLSLDDRSLYRTRDGGKNWNRLVASGIRHFDSLLFVNPTHGLAIAGWSELYETLDGGITWRLIKTGFWPRSLCSLDALHVWVLSDTELYRVSFD